MKGFFDLVTKRRESSIDYDGKRKKLRARGLAATIIAIGIIVVVLYYVYRIT